VKNARPNSRPFDQEEIVCGRYACEALFKKRPQDLIKFYTLDSDIDRWKLVMSHCAQNKLGYRMVSADDLKKISHSDHHEGIVMIARKRVFPAWKDVLKNMKTPSSILILDGVFNPHNLGAIARSGAHFGISGFFSFHSEMKEITPSTYRVAQGGWEYFPSYFLKDIAGLFDELKKQKFQIIGLDSHAKKNLKEVLDQFSPAQHKIAFIMGAEDRGLHESLKKEIVTASIPGTGVLDSLNVSQATSIALALWRMGIA
jgi:TrmH RNA methyltransferase